MRTQNVGERERERPPLGALVKDSGERNAVGIVMGQSALVEGPLPPGGQ